MYWLAMIQIAALYNCCWTFTNMCPCFISWAYIFMCVYMIFYLFISHQSLMYICANFSIIPSSRVTISNFHWAFKCMCWHIVSYVNICMYLDQNCNWYIIWFIFKYILCYIFGLKKLLPWEFFFCGVLSGVGGWETPPPIHPHVQHMYLTSSPNACQLAMIHIAVH